MTSDNHLLNGAINTDRILVLFFEARKPNLLDLLMSCFLYYKPNWFMFIATFLSSNADPEIIKQTFFIICLFIYFDFCECFYDYTLILF